VNPRNVRLGRAAAIPITGTRGPELTHGTTRYTMLLPLPRMAGYGIEPRTTNGPALASYGAVALRDALTGQRRQTGGES
jgi:hypothetical protein